MSKPINKSISCRNTAADALDFSGLDWLLIFRYLFCGRSAESIANGYVAGESQPGSAGNDINISGSGGFCSLGILLPGKLQRPVVGGRIQHGVVDPDSAELHINDLVVLDGDPDKFVVAVGVDSVKLL